MISTQPRRIAFSLCAWLIAAPAYAGATLEVSPVMLDVTAPGATGAISVKNDDTRAIPVQLRLFRWRQHGGQEAYEATQDVIASPPMATIQPGATLTVRVIRAAQTPVQGEESYRLVIDQLPEADRNGRAKVSMLLRQVLPIFFGEAGRAGPQVSWSIAPGPNGYLLKAHNEGDRRLRVAEVALSGAHGPTKLGGGLLGYVLAHADMSWTLSRSYRPGGSAIVQGVSDQGKFRATAPLSP